MPPATGAPAPVKYIPSSNLITPSSYLEQLVYTAAGETPPSATPASSELVPAGTAPPPTGQVAYPTAGVQNNPAGSPEYADGYGQQIAPDPSYQAAPADPYYTGGGASTYYGGPSGEAQPYGTGQTASIYPAQNVQDPYGGSGDQLNTSRGYANYGGFDAAQMLPAAGEHNWSWQPNADPIIRTAQGIGEWAGILPSSASAQYQDELGQVRGGGGGVGRRPADSLSGGTRAAARGQSPAVGQGRPGDSIPGSVRAARAGWTGGVRSGDSLTANPARTTASLPSSQPIGTGRRVISTSATANPSAPRNRGQIQSGAQAVGDPYARMPTGTTRANTSVPGYTVASGNPAPATGVTGTTPAGRAALPAGTTAFPPLPFSPTMGVPGLNALTPKQIGAGLAGLAGLGAGAMFGPAFVEDVALRDVTEGVGESTFVPGDPYGPRAPWPSQGQRVGSSSARDQGDVRADTLGSAGLRDAAWTSGTRDYLEDRGQNASPAVDPYATSAQPASSPATTPVVNEGDVSRNRAAKLLTPDLQFVTSERTSDAFGGGTGSYSLRVIHGEPGAPVATDAIVTPQSMAAAQEAGMAPWILNADEFTILVDAGLVTAEAQSQVVGRPLLIPKEWAGLLPTGTGDPLTDVQAVDPYTAPAAADTSSGGGSGWVDYGNSGGGYARRSYSRGGGGGGYSGGGYSGGGGGWERGGMDFGSLPDGFGGEDGFMSGAFDSPIFARYFDVLSRHMGEDGATSLMQRMRGMKRGVRRSKRSRTRSMSGGKTLTTKGPRPSSVNEGLNVPSNDRVRQDVGKQVKKATKGKDA